MAGAFGGEIAEGADEGGGTGLGDEPGIGQAGLAFEVNDVGGFEVAMDEAGVVQMGEGIGKGAAGGEGDFEG